MLCQYDIFIRALFYIIPALAMSIVVNITKFMEVRLFYFYFKIKNEKLQLFVQLSINGFNFTNF